MDLQTSIRKSTIDFIHKYSYLIDEGKISKFYHEALSQEDLKLVGECTTALYAIGEDPLMHLGGFIPTGFLFNVTIPDTFQIPSFIEEIEDRAFAYSDIQNVKIPDKVLMIKDMTFTKCIHLTSIDLNNVKQIGDFAFHSCINLKSIELPQGCKEIGISSFSSCSNLIDVKVPSGIKIKHQAFEHCYKLKSIELPGDVILEGDHIFPNNSSFIIRCPRGCRASQYAINHGIKVQYI